MDETNKAMAGQAQFLCKLLSKAALEAWLDLGTLVLWWSSKFAR
jgi:hypothetical protein